MTDNHEAYNWRMSAEEHDSDGGLALKESRPELKRPPLFKVVLINDDYTPMEFVVEVLEVFFRRLSECIAEEIHGQIGDHDEGQ